MISWQRHDHKPENSLNKHPITPCTEAFFCQKKGWKNLSTSPNSDSFFLLENANKSMNFYSISIRKLEKVGKN